MPHTAESRHPFGPLGACTWSLRTPDPASTVHALEACGISIVQLALEPFRTGAWKLDDAIRLFQDRDIRIASGMMSMHAEDYTTLESIHATGGLRSTDAWPINRSAATQNAEIAKRLSINLVTFHAGFLPADPADPMRRNMLDRLREVASTFADRGISVALETGQESGSTLRTYLEELRHLNVGVNFDSANMILYGSGDPITALRELLPWVRQVHIKDAIRTSVPGTWGDEVPVGSGEVGWPEFFTELARAPLPIPLMIEREAGESRIADIRRAAELVRRHTITQS